MCRNLSARPLPVPAGSTLIVRSSGGTLDVIAGGGVSETAPAEQAPKGTNEKHFTIAGDGTVHVRAPSGQPQWKFTAIPDRPPTISLAKDPERQARGSLQMAYKIEDDYGVTEARAEIAARPGDQQAQGLGQDAGLLGIGYERLQGHGEEGAEHQAEQQAEVDGRDCRNLIVAYQQVARDGQFQQVTGAVARLRGLGQVDGLGLHGRADDEGEQHKPGGERCHGVEAATCRHSYGSFDKDRGRGGQAVRAGQEQHQDADAQQARQAGQPAQADPARRGQLCP